MKDYHFNILYSNAELEKARTAWLAADMAESKPVRMPRYRPVIYRTAS
jgi:hypothetical protein